MSSYLGFCLEMSVICLRSRSSCKFLMLQEVTAQIWATLYDYPCLKDCPGLRIYIDRCVRVSWGLVNQVRFQFLKITIYSFCNDHLFQIPQYAIEYETRVFQPDLHVRFHTSENGEKSIRTYLWPALREGKTGPCVHKAVVLT